jgi:hypothetical protein
MKKLKISLVALTIFLVSIGICIANKGQKMFSQAIAYYTCNGTNWHSVTLDVAVFDVQGSATQAALRDQNNNARLLYLNQSTTNPAKFTCPLLFSIPIESK